MAKLEIVKILLFQQKQHKSERELCYTYPELLLLILYRQFVSLNTNSKKNINFPAFQLFLASRYRCVCLRLSLRNLTALIIDTPRSTPRTQNWSKDEVLRLLRLVKERKDIIKGKFSPMLTIKHKREAWWQITEALRLLSQEVTGDRHR